MIWGIVETFRIISIFLFSWISIILSILSISDVFSSKRKTPWTHHNHRMVFGLSEPNWSNIGSKMLNRCGFFWTSLLHKIFTRSYPIRWKSNWVNIWRCLIFYYLWSSFRWSWIPFVSLVMREQIVGYRRWSFFASIKNLTLKVFYHSIIKFSHSSRMKRQN